MKLSDYIAHFLATDGGISHVFMLTGGGAMHLNDSFGKHKALKIIHAHHEQSLAMAAESYTRYSGKIAVVNPTTGPGGLNTLNGVFGAFTDSLPMLIISGQVKRETSVRSLKLEKLRQIGDQECNIIPVVTPITKYAVSIESPDQIKYELQKALFLAQSGRPGPVWIDIPLDIQSAEINPDLLENFQVPTLSLANSAAQLDSALILKILEKLKTAQRPVILVGTGVRIAGQAENLINLINLLKIPVVTAFNAHDLIPNDYFYYAGRPGTVGDRAGNFAVQNSDCLLILGCRMNVRQIGYAFSSFSREAFKIMVEIDPEELNKPTLQIDLKIQADLKIFMPSFIKYLNNFNFNFNFNDVWSSWVDWCKARVKKYDVVLSEYFEKSSPIHPYVFMRALSRALPNHAITVTGDGTACVTAFQSFEIKARDRLYSNSGAASMGYDLPAAIGAHIASSKPVVCLAGDGSIMMNLQELAQIGFHRYPIKIFLINNGGYLSIRLTQQAYFKMPFVGCGSDSGIGFPNFEKLADSFGIQYKALKSHDEFLETDFFNTIFNHDEPILCEVFCQQVPFAPKMASKKLDNGKMVSRPLEDMAPFLSREELLENLCIQPLPEV